MVQAALYGETVVRLKGGDPMIFGRAGEEIAACIAAGIQVEVVSGVSAGVAASANLQAPLTHREHAQGVVFVTGHRKPNGEITDWIALGQAAAQLQLTLVIYMGVAQAAQIQSGLLTHLTADTPVTLVQNASRVDQRKSATVLGDLCACLAADKLGSPLVMVIGKVVYNAQLVV